MICLVVQTGIFKEPCIKLEIITEKPKQRKYATPLLLVHGAWHGAWCWEKFLPYFAYHGYEVHALSLRGHGNSEGRDGIRWFSAAHDYVADITQVVNGLDKPPVLIGHSMGGYVVQKYLETHHAPAGVLLASVPTSGILVMLLKFLFRHPWATIKTLFLMNPWYLVNSPELVKEGFFSDEFPDEEIARLFPYIRPESFRAALEMTVLSLPGPKRVKTPLLVLGAENDRIFSVREEQSTAHAYQTEAVMFTNMAHDMMLERDWQKVADKILAWLDTREL